MTLISTFLSDSEQIYIRNNAELAVLRRNISVANIELKEGNKTTTTRESSHE